MTLLADWESRLDEVMLADRTRFHRWIEQARRLASQGKPFDRLALRLAEEIPRSIATRAQRRLTIPPLSFDESLPVNQHRATIAAAIRDHQVVVLCGETGSGKSTQLPKICLELGRGVAGMIAHTQPRRIAARSVAARVADELNTPLGQLVGFKVRFTDATQPTTLVKLLTDGLLLAESQHDRYLDAYDTIILDEAHERSLNIDFLIGLLARLLPRRRDLKLIVTSATIDAQRFADHFSTWVAPTPILEVSGRVYPVEVRYRPVELAPGELDVDPLRAVCDAVDEALRFGPGDVLVFMPTERDIHETAKRLRPRLDQRGIEILPLYARLSNAEQQRVFQPHPLRRVVIATNVAESSLTVPGIRAVVDPGTARISRYNARTKMQRLPIEPVSRASADQRRGRCGRVGPGLCLRLYSAEDYESREAFTLPEIQRTNLAAVVLRSLSLGFGSLDRFPFLDPPRPEAVRDGLRTLFELGAIDESERLTKLGERMSRWPVDPRVGRMILAGHEEHCLSEILIIAAALEVQDPRDRPFEQAASADACHAQFAHPDSDFLSYLKLWDQYHAWKSELSRSKLEKACRQNFLSYVRMREWLDVHRQLVELVEQAGDRLLLATRRDDSTAIHRALITGLLANVAFRPEGHEYSVAGGGRSSLWPGSSCFEKKPRWIVAAEQIETSKRFLRTVARVDPSWIESLAGHLIKRSYSDPHWDGRSGTVLAFEKVSLYGLPIVARRRVRYGPIDPVQSRRLFLLHALVEGDISTRGDFLEHNRALLERVRGWEHKSRASLLRDDDARYDFYDRIVPAEVYDTHTFERWRRGAERANRSLLHMAPADLLADPNDVVSDTEFPDALDCARMELPLAYRHNPGGADDGVTLVVPEEGLNQLDRHRLGWLVPGLLAEKVTALIKSLPKSIRTRFVPIPDTVRDVLTRLEFGRGSIQAAVAEALGAIRGQPVRLDDFQDHKLPDYLRMNIRVVDARGASRAVGRDLNVIRSELGQSTTARGGAIDDESWRRDGLTTWDFGDWPESVDLTRGNVHFRGYPALLDRETSVSLRLLDLPERARRETQAGLRRLFYLVARRELEMQVAWLPNRNQLQLASVGRGDADRLDEQLALLIAERAFLADDAQPRSTAEFQARLKRGKQHIVAAVQEVMRLIAPLLKHEHEVRLAVESIRSPGFAYAVDDVRAQLRHLTPPQYLTTTPWSRLVQYPRYLRGMLLRLDKLRGGRLSQDQRLHAELAPRWEAYLQRWQQHQEHALHDPALIAYRWLLEEFRISLFAQELGTAQRVSAKKLDEQWNEIRL